MTGVLARRGAYAALAGRHLYAQSPRIGHSRSGRLATPLVLVGQAIMQPWRVRHVAARYFDGQRLGGLDVPRPGSRLFADAQWP